MQTEEGVMMDALQICYDRLSAWADNAEWHLYNCRSGEEEKWRNQRDNYRLLANKCQAGIAASRKRGLSLTA